MIESTGPVIIITRAELIAIIDQAASRAVQETLKHFAGQINAIRPASVTRAEAARMLRKSPPTISKMVKAGVFRLNKLGKIPIEQIDQALRSN